MGEWGVGVGGGVDIRNPRPAPFGGPGPQASFPPRKMERVRSFSTLGQAGPSTNWNTSKKKKKKKSDVD